MEDGRSLRLEDGRRTERWTWDDRHASGVTWTKDEGRTEGRGKIVRLWRDSLLVPGCWFLVAGSWLLVAGSWLLVSGCWLLVPGCWFLVAGYKRERKGKNRWKREDRPPLA
jgi:hypothetical protein